MHICIVPGITETCAMGIFCKAILELLPFSDTDLPVIGLIGLSSYILKVEYRQKFISCFLYLK